MTATRDEGQRSLPHEVERRQRRVVQGAVGAALAGRALVGHLTLPLLVVVKGAGFLPLLIARPSEATLVVGGTQARDGLIAWPVLVALAVIGAVISDSLSYAAGRVWGDRALRRLAHHGRHGSRPSAVGRVAAWSHRLMGRSAPLAVALGHPTVITHGVAPVMAGSAGVRFPVFLAASVTGAVAWVALWITGGAAVGALWEQSRVVVVASATAIVAAGVTGWVVCRRSPRCHVAAA